VWQQFLQWHFSKTLGGRPFLSTLEPSKPVDTLVKFILITGRPKFLTLLWGSADPHHRRHRVLSYALGSYAHAKIEISSLPPPKKTGLSSFISWGSCEVKTTVMVCRQIKPTVDRVLFNACEKWNPTKPNFVAMHLAPLIFLSSVPLFLIIFSSSTSKFSLHAIPLLIAFQARKCVRAQWVFLV